MKDIRLCSRIVINVGRRIIRKTKRKKRKRRRARAGAGAGAGEVGGEGGEKME